MLGGRWACISSVSLAVLRMAVHAAELSHLLHPILEVVLGGCKDGRAEMACARLPLCLVLEVMWSQVSETCWSEKQQKYSLTSVDALHHTSVMTASVRSRVRYIHFCLCVRDTTLAKLIRKRMFTAIYAVNQTCRFLILCYRYECFIFLAKLWLCITNFNCK